MKTKFVFLLIENVHPLDLAGPVQTILEAIDFGAPFEIQYCSYKNEILDSSGLKMSNLTHFYEIQFSKDDYLIIPGARLKFITSQDFRDNKLVFKWIQEFYKQKVNLVSICSGAFALAETGLLNNLSCTSHFNVTSLLQEMYPFTKVKENILFTDEKNIYTSAGIASGIDLMLHILEKITNGNMAFKVAREMVIYNRRTGESQQFNPYFLNRNHIHSGVHKAQDYIIENIHLKSNLSDISEIACMSERNFTRVFKKETGKTVHEYISEIRKEKIKELLLNPDLTRKQIAQSVGLESDKQIFRILKMI